MFIASAFLDDGQLLVLGLSTENRQRLDEGLPMDITRETHGLSIPKGLRIVIFTGDTEESMAEYMSGLIGPNTVINQKKEV